MQSTCLRITTSATSGTRSQQIMNIPTRNPLHKSSILRLPIMTKIRRRKAVDDENLNLSSSWNEMDDPTLLVFAAIIIVVVTKYDVDAPTPIARS